MKKLLCSKNVFLKSLFVSVLYIVHSLTSSAQTVVNFSQENAVQNFTVPAGVTTATITAVGAGGGGGTASGGVGASIQATCTVTPGHKISIVVGQLGQSNNAGGGGGGTFVFDSNTGTLLVVGAGAGGGGFGNSSNSGGDGGIDVITYTTTNGTGGNAAGGVGGNGGNRGSITNGSVAGSGGGGWISNGDSLGSTTSFDCMGGFDMANFFAGGNGAQGAGNGGYGGGGGGGWDAGSGGGGYNGGGGGNAILLFSSGGGGGGGGSYLIGTAALLSNVLSSTSSDGSAQIQYNPIPCTLTTTASINNNVGCFSGSNGEATANPSNGTTPYTYSWVNAGSIVVSTSNPTGSVLTAGSYTLTVKDANSCTATALVNISQPNPLVIGVTSVSITLTNSQSVSTAPNFQQMVVINSSNYASYEMAGLQNVEFTTGPGSTGTVLQAWIESGASNASTNTIYWVNLGSTTIPATGSLTIYMNFVQSNILSASGPTGEAPQLSGTYAQYDNGSLVFGNYWNFSGPSIPSGLTSTIGSLGSIVYNDGATMTLSSPAWGTYITTSSAFSPPMVVESDIAQNADNPSAAEAALVVSTSSSLANGASTYAGYDETSSSSDFTFVYDYDNGGTGFPWSADLLGSTSNDNAFNVWTMGINSSGNLGFGDINYTDLLSGTSNAETLSNFYIGIQTTQQNATFQWLRTRVYPPSETMPSIALGSTSTLATVLNVSCSGGSSGSATTTVSGGTSPYTYLWNDVNNQTTLNATGLSAGSYTIDAVDANSCTAAASVTITQSSVLVRDSIVFSTNEYCNGENIGTAKVGLKGASFPYTYLWNDASSQTTALATGLVAGSYTVTLMDKNGCSGSSSPVATITQPDAIRDSVTSITPPLCYGGSATIYIGEKGGTTPYSYHWSNGLITTSTTVNVLVDGTYTVTVKDFHNCANTAIVFTPTQPPALHDSSVSASQINASCNGATNGSLTIGIKYGVFPYTYVWSPNVSSTATATGLSAGTYSITFTDINGCSNTTAIATITQPNAIRDSVISITSPVCYGENATIFIGEKGGTAPYSYYWTNGLITTSTTVSALADGTYTVTVKDLNHCVNTPIVFTPTEPAAIRDSMASITYPTCNGGQGMTTIGIKGGTSPYTYHWSNGINTTSPTLSNLEAGTYTITVKDLHNCANTAVAFTMTQPTALHATTHAGTHLASVHVTGGTSPYTYLWSPGGEITDTIKGLTAGTYTVDITDKNGCTESASVHVTVTGIENIDNVSSTLNIYPDPNNGYFTIAGILRGQIIEVYDYTGKMITTTTANNESMQFNLSAQANGVYLVRILSKDGILIGQKKIVKAN